jgi:UDP-N-acetylmuramate--alanine ligase
MTVRRTSGPIHTFPPHSRYAELKPLLLDASDHRPVHFMGIGGAGMSALAEFLVTRGVRVTGCDTNPHASEHVSRCQCDVAVGHAPEHVQGARALVYTSAVPRDHAEIERARASGIPAIRRAEALAAAVSGGLVVAVAGTHGKTTTTVMTTEALTVAGLNPTGVAGGRVGEWDGNLRNGGNDLFVVEADEYDRSFLALDPTVAIVTNVEADHLDIYADLDDIKRTFATFVRGARSIVLCADDPGANSLAMPSSAEVIRYGTGTADARLRAKGISGTEGGSTFTVEYDGDDLGLVTLQVPGLHNVRNALAAVGAGIALGVEISAMAKGLADFHGVERRFQRIADVRGVTIVDDYAHHPTEITATLSAARLVFPGRRIVVAFQPHLYSRTRDFAREFGDALSLADRIFLADIYPAREQPIPGVSSALIGDALRQAQRLVVWMGPVRQLARALARDLVEGDVVLTVGAGDVTEVGPQLAAVLSEASPSSAKREQ